MKELGPVGTMLVGLLVLILASQVLDATPAYIATPILAAAMIVYAFKITEYDLNNVFGRLKPKALFTFSGVAFWGVFIGCLVIGAITLTRFFNIHLTTDLHALALAMQVGIGAAAVAVITSVFKLGRTR
jgi:hypothetical protein